MLEVDWFVIFPIIGFGAFLWLALFILTRFSLKSPLSIAGFAGAVSQSYYFLISVLNSTAVGKDLGVLYPRIGWWANCLPIAFWFHISYIVSRRRQPVPFFTPMTTLVYTSAAAFAFFGTFTEAFMAYSTVIPDQRNKVYVNPGPDYGFYSVYLATVGLLSIVNFAVFFKRTRSDNGTGLRYQASALFAGGCMFLLGGVYLALKFQFAAPWPDYPALILIMSGLCLFGWGVGTNQQLVEGETVQRRFFYNLAVILAINLVISTLMILAGIKSPVTLLVLVGLVTLNNMFYDRILTLADYFFFTRKEQEARSSARSFVNSLETNPLTLTEAPAGDGATGEIVPESSPEVPESSEPAQQFELKTFKQEVRRAISDLKTHMKLVNSSLLRLKLIENRLKQKGLSDSRLNRAEVLYELLTEMIEKLRPDQKISGYTTETWRFYNVLYYPYVRGISKNEAHAVARRLAEERHRQGIAEAGDVEKVAEWLSNIEEATFFKWQRKASDVIAEGIFEEELKLHPQNSPAQVKTETVLS